MLRLGDVVIVRLSPHRIIMHRIIARSRDGLLIRGDASPKVDGYFDDDSILGVVRHNARKDRKIRFGLGPERIIIALLSRTGLLQGALGIMRFAKRSLHSPSAPEP